ncbi:MAG: RNA 3'-terminal phosphate cyclase [Candidatus Lokiarchaeota archaeon]
MKNKEIIEIDGSFGEGGGSILRLSAGFSVLFNKPIKVRNIRANRSNPGLRLQHLLGLKSLANLTNGDLSKCEVGTTTIKFYPNNDFKDELKIKVGTAASIGLLLQPIQIACMGISHPEKIQIIIEGGGTFGKWAPSINYLKHVTYRIFELYGYKLEVNIEKYGFYPKGGAKTFFTIYPPKSDIEPLDLTELGEINRIEGEIICTSTLMKPRVAERIQKSAEKYLINNLNLPLDIKYKYVNSLSTGVGLSLWTRSKSNTILSTGTILGEKGTSSEEVGRKAAKVLVSYINKKIPVDNFLSDQLIPFMANIKGESRIKVSEISSHTKTNLELIKQFNNREYQITRDNNSYIIQYL